MNSNWWTTNQQHYIRVLLLKIKTKYEWSHYRLIVNGYWFRPFLGNNTIHGGLTIDTASMVIKALLDKTYQIKKI